MTIVEPKTRQQTAQESSIIINNGRVVFLQKNGHFSSVFTAIVTNTMSL